jgi:fructokinase
MGKLLVPALELGGTKTVAALGTADGVVKEEVRFPTTSPEETLGQALRWWKERGALRAGGVIGVGSFGPIRVRRQAGDYGVMLTTPKPGWSGFPVAGFLGDSMPGMEVRVETDVNAAALAEARLGAAAGHADMAYITVGTGIGAGVLTGGRLVHGAVHPELGHLRVPRHPEDDFTGCCPYHGDCLEGLACGPAIHKRWGREGRDLPGDHPAWDMEAWYLAHGILALCAVTCPGIVVLGGGVPQAEGLHDRVATCLRGLSNGYYEAAEKEGFVVPPKLGQQAGIAGALMLAAEREGGRRKHFVSRAGH